MKQSLVMFIQGGGPGAHDADAKLVASLENRLGESYKLSYPLMPNEDDPDYSVWSPQIKQALATADGPLVLVGHSLGAYMLLKYLAENDLPNVRIDGLCIISAPYPGGDENWQYEGFSLPEDWATKLPKGAKTFLYHSQDDQMVSFAHMRLYANDIPGSVARITTGGHQLGNDLTLVAKDIQSLHA